MTSKQEAAAAAVLMPRTRAVHSFRLKLRWSVRLRRHVHIPANTTAGRHMCTIALIFTPAGLHAHTTKVHKVLGARIYHGRMAYVAPNPPHGWPATGAYDKYFFPTPRPEPSGKAATARSRRHKRFTVAGASRPRASTPGSRSTASGSSAGTRTSPTRPGTGDDDARFYNRQQAYVHARVG